MWSLVTHRGNSYHGSRSATSSTAALAVGIKDLVLRPVSLFPMHLVTSVVSAFLLRHNNYSLRSECIRMKLPAHVARGLEVGWQWLLSLSIGVLLRKSMTIFPADDDPLHMATELDEDYANDMVLDAYGIPQQTVAQSKGSASLLHGGRLRSTDAALSRSESRSRSPVAVPHVAQMHQHHYQPVASSQRPQAFSLDRNSHHTHHNKPSLEMLASGAADTLIDGDIRQRDHHITSRSQRDSSDAHVMMHGGGTSFYTSIGGPMPTRGAALAESIDHSSFYGAGRATSRTGTMSGLVSSTARSHQVHHDSNSVYSSSRGSSRAPSPTVRKKLAFR
ncbi:Hypothetical protein, putative [Bodo saltans]|uniref:Uncharacterized protein n=1 Tax=Bodo saltans TaxID=75058 RepID=A0A0S4J4W2_BODSA|nr:Hypothetical protein, putative [Bodo saltans]|eukprot:CUG82167.1 Hypothetical protein, putative [Bodo saltans]